MSNEHTHDHDDRPEPPDPALLRQVANVVLDGVSADLADAGTDPVELAFDRLVELDAIELFVDDEEDELELDVSPLMGGVMLVVGELVNQIARRDQVSPEEVIASIREALG